MTRAPLAIVTGASSGIGYEFSRNLSSRGWDTLMISNQASELRECARNLEQEFNVKATPLCLDLSEEDASSKIVAHLRSSGQCPTLLINNAGIFDFKSVAEMSEKRVRLYIDLHVRIITLLCRDIAAMMREHGIRGYILNMSSMSCWMPMPGISLYSATKAYIRVFSRALDVELRDDGISVTVACPGGIATDLFGLKENLKKLGVRLGVLARPDKFAEKTLNRTFKRRHQYINGLINRAAIPMVASLPFGLRRYIKHRLLDKNDGI